VNHDTTYEPSLAALQFLGHFVVVLLGFLDLLRHALLLALIFLDQLVGILDLIVDHTETVG
jgi:hypothetical protein